MIKNEIIIYDADKVVTIVKPRLFNGHYYSLNDMEEIISQINYNKKYLRLPQFIISGEKEMLTLGLIDNLNLDYRSYLNKNLSMYPFISEMSNDDNATLLVLMAILNANNYDLFSAYQNKIMGQKVNIIRKFLKECGIQVKQDNIPDPRMIIKRAKDIYNIEGNEWLFAFNNNIDIEIDQFDFNNVKSHNPDITEDLYMLNFMNYKSAAENLQHNVTVNEKHIKKYDEYYELKLIWAANVRARDFRSTLADAVVSLKNKKSTSKTKKFLKNLYYNQWNIDLENTSMTKQKWLKEHYILTETTNPRILKKWKRRLDKMSDDIEHNTGYLQRKVERMMRLGLSSSLDELELNTRFFKKNLNRNKELKWLLEPEKEIKNLLIENAKLKTLINVTKLSQNVEPKIENLNKENVYVLERQIEDLKNELHLKNSLIGRLEKEIVDLKDKVDRFDKKIYELSSDAIRSYDDSADSEEVSTVHNEKSNRLIGNYNKYVKGHAESKLKKQKKAVELLNKSTKIRLAEVEYDDGTSEPTGKWVMLGENTKKALGTVMLDYTLNKFNKSKDENVNKVKALFKIFRETDYERPLNIEVEGIIMEIKLFM
jgi:hypothetical protein